MFDPRAFLCAIALAVTPANAAEMTGTQMLFGTGHIADLGMGATLAYSHDRSGVAELDTQPIEDGSIVITIFEDGENRRSKVTMRNGERKRALEHLPTDKGNPIFVVFLESTLTTIAKASKGSPFYLRNRFKEALATGGIVTETTVTLDDRTVAATRIEYRPFTDDRNKAKLGKAMANLALTFTLSEEVPGEFIELKAQAEAEGETVLIEAVRFQSLIQAEN